MVRSQTDITRAYTECRRLARRHYENFPVASYLVPREKRDALAAIYAFARSADDFADEPRPAVLHASGCKHSRGPAAGRGEPGIENRGEALAEWRRRLGDCFAGRPHEISSVPSDGSRSLFVALGDAAARFELSKEHFENLLRAFELDTRVSRHLDFSSLQAYCTLSANPVGRLVLELFGHRDPELFALSDSICTALQLANFWQDVAIDFDRGRVYLPLEDLERFGYSVEDLAARRADERWRRLMAFEVARTRELFEGGKALPEKVVPELRRQLRLTWLGGMRILKEIESAGYDVFRRRPELGLLDFFGLYFKARRPLR